MDPPRNRFGAQFGRLPEEPRVSLVGRVLGEFDVRALIGHGAMGAVYLARDLGLDRDVALKVLLASLARDAALVRQFHREAATAAPLRHPGIVQIYAAGIAEGVPYIAMEYIEGEPLDRFLNRQGKVAWQTALYVGQQVAEALDCAHGKGVVHRDVKPANILLDGHGRTHLTDFGIADVVTRDASVSGRDEDFVGTPHYMSPEQCARGEIDFRTDLYSLGVTLYLMIAGRLPFENDSPMALMKSIMDDEPRRLNRVLPEVPDDVARLVAHMMAKDPDQRVTSARAICRTIERLQAERGGRSAMPAALLAFMREQTRIRPVRSIIRPGAVGDLEIPRRPLRPPLPVRALVTRAITVVAALVVGTCVPVLAGFLSSPPPPPKAPPLLDSFELREVSSDLRIAQFGLDGYAFESLRWFGGAHVLLVTAAGPLGALTQGAVGLLAVDLEGRRCISIQTPANRVLVANYDQVRVPTYGSPATPFTMMAHPLDEVVLVPSFSPGPRGGERFVDIRARKWNHIAEESALLLRLPESQWNREMRAPWVSAVSGYVAQKPDGYTICVALNDPADGATYLAERDVRWEEPGKIGPRLTTKGDPILPWTVQYSLSGERIMYVRVSAAGRRELWVYEFGRDKTDGKPVALDIVGNAAAFDRLERVLAVSVQREGREPELRLVSGVDSTVLAHLGPGEFGAQPWHPSGSYVIATAQGRVWAIEAEAPNRRIALSPPEMRFRQGASFTTTGLLAAAAFEIEGKPAIAFIRVGALDFAAAEGEEEKGVGELSP